MINERELAERFAQSNKAAMAAPKQRHELLLNAIRKQNLAECRWILEKNPEEIINAPSDMTEGDIFYLAKHSGLERESLAPRYTTKCPSIFYAVIYNFTEVFEFLHKKGADLNAKSAADVQDVEGVDLGMYVLACKSTPRIQDYLAEHATALWKKALYAPGNPFVIEAEYRHVHSDSEFNTTELECLVFAAKTNSVMMLHDAINAKVMSKDSDGTAIEQALANGNVDCVRALKNADSPIMARHYVAAGRAADDIAKDMYCIMIGDNIARYPQYSAEPVPNFIQKENLAGLHERFENPVDNASKARWLFHSIQSGKILMMRYLLEKGAQVEPQHYFAGGISGKLVSKGELPAQTNVRLLRMLIVSDPKQPRAKLPQDFYSPEEQHAYASVVAPDSVNNNNTDTSARVRRGK